MEKIKNGVVSEYFNNTNFPKDLPKVGKWEVDFGESPMPLPFPTLMILVVERDSYFILHTSVAATADPFAAFREAILKAVTKNNMFPESFIVKDSETAQYLNPVAKEIGVPCEIVKKLKAIPIIRRDMAKMLGEFISKPEKRQKKAKTNAKKSSGNKPKCGLCGKSGKIMKTDCCGNYICDDQDSYVLFSYARNSCARNHERFTLCAYHKNEGHKGNWKDCKKCLEEMGDELEMYVWYGTNEYNFTKLENPPTFKPTYCGNCGKHLPLPDGGYLTFCGEYRCDTKKCEITDKEKEALHKAHFKNTKKK
jgi:hypothetical protein